MPLVTVLTEAQATAIDQVYFPGNAAGNHAYNIGSCVTIPSDTPAGRRVLRYFWTQLHPTTQAILTNAVYEPPCERLWDRTPLPLPN
jgi:hypothetical protein